MIGSRNTDLINQVIESFRRDNDILHIQLNDILYWYRGSFTRDDVWMLTPYEREKAVEFLNNRFKDAGEMMKKQIPVFL